MILAIYQLILYRVSDQDSGGLDISRFREVPAELKCRFIFIFVEVIFLCRFAIDAVFPWLSPQLAGHEGTQEPRDACQVSNSVAEVFFWANVHLPKKPENQGYRQPCLAASLLKPYPFLLWRLYARQLFSRRRPHRWRMFPSSWLSSCSRASLMPGLSPLFCPCKLDLGMQAGSAFLARATLPDPPHLYHPFFEMPPQTRTRIGASSTPLDPPTS